MPEEPLLITSPLLQQVGVPHCFTTRVGGSAGVSTGMFASLNFGNPGDIPRERRDPPANIALNLAAVAHALGSATRPIVQVHQVHGPAVHVVEHEAMDHPELLRADPKADAIVTNAPVLAGIRTADCAPVLLASHDGAIVGAVHAGWRGVIGGVLTETIKAMRTRGAKHIVASIGPCIGQQSFEVDADVADQFDRRFGRDSNVVAELPRRSDVTTQKYGINLQRALQLQLQTADIAEVDIIPHCTFERSDLYFSHRREKGLTGRMIALIGPAL